MAAEAVVLAAVVVEVDAVVAVAVDAVVAVEDMSGSSPGTPLKHCKPVAKKWPIGRNELSLNGQNRRKGEVISGQNWEMQNLPKTEVYPPSRPPSYIDIPTQNFLVILETATSDARNKTPSHFFGEARGHHWN